MAGTALAQGALGSTTDLSSIIPPNRQPIPPAIPGATAHYSTQIPHFPVLGMLSLGGGTAWPAFPQGGISVLPQPDTGTVHGWAWWPDCEDPQVVRIHQDGSRNPVRGAFPLDLAGATTRRNYATNPSMEAGLNGYLANQGTLSTITRTDLGTDPNVKALKCTLSGAGNPGVTVPQSLPPIGTALTVGFDMRLSAQPSGGVAVSATFVATDGTALGTASATVPAATMLAAVGQWATASLSILPPVGAATATGVTIIATGLASGGWIELDRIVLPGSDPNTAYADGDALGGSWTGVPDLSVSVLAPIVEFDDGECPLDVLVSYVITCTDITGGSATTDTVQLDSLPGQSWATHPSDPARPLRFIPKDSAPTLTRVTNAGSFLTLDARNPVFLTPLARAGMSGSIIIGLFSYAERDQWTDPVTGILADLQPILLRFPRDYGYGYYVWWFIGDTVEDPSGLGPQQDLRMLTLPFTEVDAPEVIGFD